MVLAAEPIISEFQADNVSTLQDKDGNYEDWIEIRNPGTEPINLQGWHLTDEKADLNQWQFPPARWAGVSTWWFLRRART